MAKPTERGPSGVGGWGGNQVTFTHLAVLSLPISAIGVGQVAILVPPTTMMCQGAVAEGDVVVSVEGGELPPIVVSKCIPCKNHEITGEGLRSATKE